MSLITNEFSPSINYHSSDDTSQQSDFKENVLIVSPSSELFDLFDHILDSVGAHVEQATSCREAIEKAKYLRPSGIIIDLDFDDHIGFDLLRVFYSLRRQLVFLAATSAQPAFQDEAKSFGAEIFFEKDRSAVLQLQSFFITILRDKSELFYKSRIDYPVLSEQISEYKYAHELLRNANSHEGREHAICYIERLGRKVGDPKLLSAKNYARQTGSTVQLSAYFNAYMKQEASEDAFSQITLMKQ